MGKVDPITLEVIGTSLRGIVREMQTSLYRTGYSTIIRESQDACCAIIDTELPGYTGRRLSFFFSSLQRLPSIHLSRKEGN